MFDEAAAEFWKQGAGYMIAFIEAAAILFLFRKIEAKDKTIENRDEIIRGLQDKRVSDYKENSEKIINTSNSLLTGMQSLKDAAVSQTNAIAKMLDNFTGRSR